MSNSAVFEDALVEARIDEIKTTRDHGFVLPADSEVDAHLAAPMSMTSTAADRAIIYDQRTGEPREVLVNMLAKTLKKKDNGKRVFDVSPPAGVKYTQGTIPCWFNPASEKFAEIQAIPGLAGFECPAAHLASEFDAELHAKHRHDRRYARVKDYMDRKERDEERAIQRASVEAMLKLAGGAAGNAAPAIFACRVDGCARFFDSEDGRKIHESKPHN